MENETPQILTKSKSSSIASITRAEKTYPVVSPDGESSGELVCRPDQPAHGKKPFASLALMLAHSSGRESLRDGEIQLLHHAVKRNQVTVDEIMEAFWRAYSDPYVSQGKIEFRHLWKYISEKRGEKEQRFTYHQMLAEMDQKSLPQEAFEILDGQQGRPEKKDSSGKWMWRYRQ